MKKLFFYVVIFLLVYSCQESSTTLDLASTWEGERIFIDAQLNVDSPIEIAISTTINPIGEDSSVPIDTLHPYLLENGSNKITLTYEDGKYVSEHKVNGGHTYQLYVDYEGEAIYSKELFIPEHDFSFMLKKKTVDADSLHMSTSVFIPDLDAYNISIRFEYSDFGMVQCNKTLNYDNECYQETKELDCIRNSVLNMMLAMDFSQCYNYAYHENDFVDLFIAYDSKDLTDQLKNNSYNRHEFGQSEVFQSSFNGAYGIFAYRYENKIKIPFK